MFPVQRTIVCKLLVQPAQDAELSATVRAFADACNFAADWARQNKVSQQFAIHKGCYREIRTKFGLSANLACRAIARVAPRMANPKTRDSVFKPTSADYDARIFTFKESDWTVSLTTVAGRRHFGMSIGQYQRDALAGKKPTAATLCRAGHGWAIHIVVDDGDVPLKPADKVLGVDLGLTDIASLSDGTRFSGAALTAQRLQRAKVRRSLQSKAAKAGRPGRRSRHRLIRRLKGREERFQKWVNHNISRRIVDTAAATGSSIAMEDLTGIRDRTNGKLRRKQRGLHNCWAFHQLRSFVSYKAQRAGVALVLVNPRNTSKTCHVCHTAGTRSGKVFHCTSHGVFDADVNAARNIAWLGAKVIGPGQSDLDAESHSVQVESSPFTVS
jgi:putative transposase